MRMFVKYLNNLPAATHLALGPILSTFTSNPSSTIPINAKVELQDFIQFWQMGQKSCLIKDTFKLVLVAFAPK